MLERPKNRELLELGERLLDSVPTIRGMVRNDQVIVFIDSIEFFLSQLRILPSPKRKQREYMRLYMRDYRKRNKNESQ